MTDEKQYITDSGDMRKYRIELPNIIDDELDPFQARLYIHYKRVCGGGNGRTCFEGIRRTASVCKMSVTKTIKTRKWLEDNGWISVEKTGEKSTMQINIIDRWPENFARYADAKPKTKSANSVTVPNIAQVEDCSTSGSTVPDIAQIDPNCSKYSTDENSGSVPYMEPICSIYGTKEVTIKKELKNAATEVEPDGSGIDLLFVLDEPQTVSASVKQAEPAPTLSLVEQCRKFRSELETAPNKNAKLMEIYAFCFGDNDLPQFSRLGSLARKVGHGLLADQMIKLAPQPPSGDKISYLQTLNKNRVRDAEQEQKTAEASPLRKIKVLS